MFPAASPCVNKANVLWFAVADCGPAVYFMNPAHQSIAAPPAAVGSSDDLMLMDCDVPQFPQPVNVPLAPPAGEPSEARGSESLQYGLSPLPGKLDDPLPFLPPEKWPTLLSSSAFHLWFAWLWQEFPHTWDFSLFSLSWPTAFPLCKCFAFFVTSCYFSFRRPLPPDWNDAADGRGGS